MPRIPTMLTRAAAAFAGAAVTTAAAGGVAPDAEYDVLSLAGQDIDAFAAATVAVSCNPCGNHEDAGSALPATVFDSGVIPQAAPVTVVDVLLIDADALEAKALAARPQLLSLVTR